MLKCCLGIYELFKVFFILDKVLLFFLVDIFILNFKESSIINIFIMFIYK